MDPMHGQRVLVTGGLGFIGSNLALRLVAGGAKVTLVDSLLPAYGGNEFNVAPAKDQLTINFSDVRDPFSLRHLVKDQDYIFSLAGQLSHIDSMTDPFTDLDINCRSQLSLLEVCRANNPRLKRVVFASTRQIYGRPQYLPVDEKHPLCPVDINGINKLAAEMYYQLYAQVYGMQTVSLRLTNTYGPRMDLRSNTKGFVGIFLKKALKGERIEIFGDGTQRRDFNYVDDVVDALLLAATNPACNGGIYNLAGDEVLSLLDFVKALQKEIPFEYNLVPFPPAHKIIDVGDYFGSAGQFTKLTGWQPKVDVADGLARTAAYFSEFRERYL